MLQDLRYAVRSLFRQPSFALTAILTLALGIGATTSIFSVVNAVLFRPLPFERPDRIVSVTNFREQTRTRQLNVSAPDFHDWKERSHSFQALAYYAGGETSVTQSGSADYAAAYMMTPGFFEALGARASLGRVLTDAEQAPGGPLAVVITDAFWKRQFNASPPAVGSTIKFSDRIFTIAGVLAPGYRFPARADIYYPASSRSETASRSGHNYRTIARLRDGVTREQAQAEMTSMARQLEQEYPASNKGKLTEVVALQELMVGATRQTMYVLLGAVAMVLLIACANVANLLLARSSIRAREMVLRAAVGAGRGRLIRQLLTESAVLWIVSGLFGVWLARLGVPALVRLAPPNLPRLDEVSVDGTALLFALAIVLAASFLFGLAPALQVFRVQLVDSLRQGGKDSSVGARTGTDDPLALVETMRRTVMARNHDVPVKATTMADTLETASATPRFQAFLLVVFATVALLLALALGRALEGLLFGVTARDPLILGLVTAVVAIASLAACYIPGRRATRVDPAIALRAE